ncbi:unnamed protein product, partial [Iphiclides podalirius]
MSAGKGAASSLARNPLRCLRRKEHAAPRTTAFAPVVDLGHKNARRHRGPDLSLGTRAIDTRSRVDGESWGREREFSTKPSRGRSAAARKLVSEFQT